MNKNILIPVAVATLGFTGVSAFAATTSTTTTTPQQSQVYAKGTGHSMKGAGFGGKMHTNLTEAEQTALESMTTEQKQAFFEKKRTEIESQMTARETVIDKLLAGQPLTAEEEALRKTIISERAAHKTEMATRKAEMEQIKTIREKQAAGTTLTASEQALLDKLPQRDQ